MQNKKLLIIGDSNCLPKYNAQEKDIINVEDIYVNLLRKKLENFDIQQMIIGGITTQRLLNFCIPYYASWVPDYVIIQSGVNDIKSQLISNRNSLRIYSLFSKLGINKSFIKEKIMYNKFLLNFKSTPKTMLNDFKQQTIKLKNIFDNSKILWIEICGDENMDSERPFTMQRLLSYNKALKEVFDNGFIELNDIKKASNFTSDGYHLNKKGHYLLYEKLKKILLSSDQK